jgi:hypothetical protein
LYPRQKEMARETNAQETFISQVQFRLCQRYEIPLSQPKISRWKLT